MSDPTAPDPFGAPGTLELVEGPTSHYDIDVLADEGVVDLDRTPFSTCNAAASSRRGSSRPRRRPGGRPRSTRARSIQGDSADWDYSIFRDGTDWTVLWEMKLVRLRCGPT